MYQSSFDVDIGSLQYYGIIEISMFGQRAQTFIGKRMLCLTYFWNKFRDSCCNLRLESEILIRGKYDINQIDKFDIFYSVQRKT